MDEKGENMRRTLARCTGSSLPEVPGVAREPGPGTTEHGDENELSTAGIKGGGLLMSNRQNAERGMG